ncbi:MAG TPA: efflux RND transporter permease subunit, partial [Pirellulales bacterium]|nr:efflux RND transporter permease subunit [Pirellulales bacterium]
GILVDEATVEVENIHTQMAHTSDIARAVRLGNAQTAAPRLLAMLCILAVFVPSFFMEGAARALFVPLSLAVGFAMLTSYMLSSTFVPVMSVWLLEHVPQHEGEREPGFLGGVRRAYQGLLEVLAPYRVALVLGYLATAGATLYFVGGQLGREVFPFVDRGEFRLRLHAPDGTRFERTEQYALEVLKTIEEAVGKDNVELTLGYVGSIPSSYPINAVFQWSRGPEEAILRIALRQGSGIKVEQLKEQLRKQLHDRLPELQLSFEPADIVNEVMSFGSPTPVEVAVSGPNLAESRAFSDKLQQELARIPALRDLHVAQSLDYPTINVTLDREKAGISRLTTAEMARSLVAATSSSRFVVPNFWPDPKTGVGYQVQVQIPQAIMKSVDELETVPVGRAFQPDAAHQMGTKQLLLRDVAKVTEGTMPGEYDRYNMRRQVSLLANIYGEDLGGVAEQVSKAIKRAGEPPKGATVEVRGQIPPMNQMQRGLTLGFALAVVVIFLLLAANFQSWRLALVAVSTTPAVAAGVALALFVTGTTLNLQSFIGAIMAIGVAMANGILLVTFAEEHRHQDGNAVQAGIFAGASRLRPILMTSMAMIAGMLPMALGLGEGGEQSAALGRAVVGGLLAATAATLAVLPSVFALVQGRASTASASLDPDDPESTHYGF